MEPAGKTGSGEGMVCAYTVSASPYIPPPPHTHTHRPLHLIPPPMHAPLHIVTFICLMVRWLDAKDGVQKQECTGIG